VSDLIDGVVHEALHSLNPRPGFSSELLGALRGTSAFPLRGDERGPSRLSRWVLPSAFAGVVGATGLLFYGLGRKHRTRTTRRRRG
jgi:hypothetical protein